MHQLIRLTTSDLQSWLAQKLPVFGADWWQKHVVDRLSFQQQRMVTEKRLQSLTDLDFAALLRVLDQNWHELTLQYNMPREARNWIKEMQSVRNKWSHLAAQDLPPSERYRDADTLERMLDIIDGSPSTRQAVNIFKQEALTALAPKESPAPPKPSDSMPPSAETSPVLFSVGELVCLRSNTSEVFPVLEVLSGAQRRYRVFVGGAKQVFYESQLQSAPQTEAQQFQPLPGFHAFLTASQLALPSSANLYSLNSGRVQFVPYQYRPVLKMIRADQPRLLIADEVGVGKTIESGLIIKELQARMELNSVLVLCPKPLVAEGKWMKEMKRFDQTFTHIDGALLKHCINETHLEGQWPEQYARAIIPFSLFSEDTVVGGEPQGRGKPRLRGLSDLDPPPKFDLVIVDEAHHIRNSETWLHQGVRLFCEHAQAVVFLTATPVQLGSNDLYTLLNVLRPDLVIDPPSFERMGEPNRYINAAIHQCREGEGNWTDAAREQLEQAGQTEWGRLFLRESPDFQAIYDTLCEGSVDDAKRVSLIRKLENLYTFSSLINRTRRRDIGNFTVRKPETLEIPFTPAQQTLHDSLLNVISRILARTHGDLNVRFLMTTISRQAASCIYGLAPYLEQILNGKLESLEWLENDGDDADAPDENTLGQIRSDISAIIKQARELTPDDPKIEAFVGAVRQKQERPNNKLLVFSSFRHTLAYLTQRAQKEGWRYGLIHGGVPDDERRELRRRFSLNREDEEAIDVLFSSEVGCEGLDFQFCDCLVNYDIPWNPMRIEQRIGRIDRYGQQSETVAVINLVTPGTIDATIYNRCLLRIGVFQHAIGGNEEILGEITREIRQIGERFDLSDAEKTAQLQQLADNEIRRIEEETLLEERQAELFGLHIPPRDWNQQVEEARSYWLSGESVQRCIESYLMRRLQNEQAHILGEKPLKTLRLSQEARNVLLEDLRLLPKAQTPLARAWEQWLRGTQPTLAITFEQACAIDNPQAIQIDAGHPLLRQAVAYLRQDDVIHTAFQVRSSALPPGEYPFALYRWEKRGVKPDIEIVVVLEKETAADQFFALLREGNATREEICLPHAAFETLDALHHDRWATAQGAHKEYNRQLVECRIQSLTVSHRARSVHLDQQVQRATHEKIRLMKQSELDRANIDFNRRIDELEKLASGGDIVATPIAFGVMVVEV
jgi:superfamily II DNA or RNA helicase